MLNILTRPPKTFFKGALKYYVARIATILGRVRGPTSVLNSLERGLLTISYPHKINACLSTDQTVHVLSNVEALRYAIQAKKDGRIKKLIAGPNIVVLPTDYDNLIEAPEIDKYLVPSIWVRDMYIKLSPVLKNKIHIWPAGVALAEPYNKKTYPRRALIFRKHAPEELYQNVIDVLLKKNIKIEKLKYGIFTQKKYFDALRRADFLIYLQEIESQGLALQEAWSQNIPTIVWNQGSFTYPTGVTVTGNISAPYMDERCGVTFSNLDEFEVKLDVFLKNFQSYEPRKYCEEELSDEVSAVKYVKILNNLPSLL